MNKLKSLVLFCLIFALTALPCGIEQGWAQSKTQKPILTKSGRKAAISKAAAVVMMAPVSATDETKIPHYFGPFPNWANSPFTLPDVAVDVTGDGTGAMATATVGASGALTGITITDPGSGYTAATVTITGGGSSATADAVVSTSGVVTGINVDAGGSGYTAPQVTILGGGGSEATAIVYGGVDAVMLTNPGSGYTNPTVDFDMPDGPDGVKAAAHAEFDPATGSITAVVVDQPGSGYSYSPQVVIRDGSIFDPINSSGTIATATATLKVQTIVLDNFGAGYLCMGP